MEIIFFILPISLCLSIGFVIAYLWAVKTGQFQDTDTPPVRILFDDDAGPAEKTDSL